MYLGELCYKNNENSLRNEYAYKNLKQFFLKVQFEHLYISQAHL